jgi:hypothetical protein
MAGIQEKADPGGFRPAAFVSTSAACVVREAYLVKRGQKGSGGGFKVLVQHLYPGDSRSKELYYGTLSPVDPHGA